MCEERLELAMGKALREEEEEEERFLVGRGVWFCFVLFSLVRVRVIEGDS